MAVVAALRTASTSVPARESSLLGLGPKLHAFAGQRTASAPVAISATARSRTQPAQPGKTRPRSGSVFSSPAVADRDVPTVAAASSPVARFHDRVGHRSS
jgi:hypothetical protein